MIFSLLSAQEDSNLVFYRYYMNLVNPAYVGATGYFNFGVNARNQNINIKGAPEIQNFILDTPIARKVAVGISATTGKTFIENRTTFSIDFSYKLKLSNDGKKLYLGLKSSFSSYSANLSGLKTYLLHIDPSLQNINEGMTSNIGFGFYFKNRESYYISFSAPSLLSRKRLSVDNNGEVKLAINKIPLYLSGGAKIKLGRNFMLKPSVLLRYTSYTPLLVDINTLFDFGKHIDLGASYRYARSITAMFIFKATEMFRIGYAYETALKRQFGSTEKGSHEIFINFKLQTNKQQPLSINKQLGKPTSS